MADAFDYAWSVVKEEDTRLKDALDEARGTRTRKPLPKEFSKKKLVRTGSEADTGDPLKSDASMYCEDVFMAMESHGLRYSQALRQVAELTGVDRNELSMACQRYRESGGQTKDFGLRGRV